MPFDPIRRPGLAYQHAFDWLAVQLASTPGPIAALAPTLFLATELIRRLPHVTLLQPLPSDINSAAITLDVPGQLTPPATGALSALALLEPLTTDLVEAHRYQSLLHPEGHLYIIIGGGLASFLTEHRRIRRAHLATYQDAITALEKADFRIREQMQLHGPRAIVWHLISQFASRLKMTHWQDRFHFAMRRDFVQTTLPPRLAALTLIVAEPIQ